MGESLERAEKQVREGHMDRILRLDKQQSGPDAVLCPINPDHGKMGVHADGNMLLCTYVTSRVSNIKLCNGHQAVSSGE